METTTDPEPVLECPTCDRPWSECACDELLMTDDDVLDREVA